MSRRTLKNNYRESIQSAAIFFNNRPASPRTQQTNNKNKFQIIYENIEFYQYHSIHQNLKL